MARSRNIKPSFFCNELLVELPFETRLLFIGLWTLADREGLLEDRPKRIKMALFPADNIDIDASLSLLAESGFLVRYNHCGSNYIQVVNFGKHQNPHHKEAASIIPEPDNYTDEPNNDSGNAEASPEPALGEPEASPVLAVLIPDSLIPDSLQSDSSVVESVVTQTELRENEENTALASDEPVLDRAVEVAKLLRAKGIQATPLILRGSDFALALLQSDADWLAAAERAQLRKPGEQISVAYLRPMVEDYGKPSLPKPTHHPNGKPSYDDGQKREYVGGLI
jgi:hypothetical protein